MQRSVKADGWAALLSNLCLAHCVLLPITVALLPSVILSGLSSHALHGPEWLHWALLALAFPISAIALRHGFRAHRRLSPWSMAVTGFLLTGIGASFHDHGLAEATLTAFGGLLIAVAHWQNFRFRQPA